MNILEYFCIFSLLVFKSFCSSDRWNSFLAKKSRSSNNDYITNKSSRKAPTDTDCRFWNGLNQPAKQKNSLAWYMPGGPQVLYYWDQSQNTCLPCTRCQKENMVTYIPCSFYRDTQCITDDKWHKLIKTKQQSVFRDEEDETKGQNLYGLIKNDNLNAKRAKGPQIYGEKMYTTTSSKNKANFRQMVMNKTGHLMDKRVFANSVNAFGKPYFYATDPNDQNAVVRKKKDKKNPINDVVREFLNNNVTGKVTVKDIIIPKTTNQQNGLTPFDATSQENTNRIDTEDAMDSTDSMYYTDPDDITDSTDRIDTQDTDDLEENYGDERKDNKFSRGDRKDIKDEFSEGDSKDIYNAFSGSRGDMEEETTEEPQSTRPIKFQQKKQSWRSNDEHASIDVYRPDKSQFERTIRKYEEAKDYQSKKQLDGEFGVEHDDIEQTNKKESAGDMAFSQIVHMLEQVDDKLDDSLLHPSGPHKKSQNGDPYLLEQILIIITIIVLALLVFLLIVVARNKYKASRFKLLDNADGVDSYQSMTSPFERSDSTTTHLTTSPSRSVLELDHTPSNNDTLQVPQAVARSLKNINPVNNQKVVKTKVAAVYVDEHGRTKLK